MALEVVCVGLRRKEIREEYRAHDYQVYLEEGNRLPQGEVEAAGEEPERAALRVMRNSCGLKGSGAISLATCNTANSSTHIITLLYTIPLSDSDILESSCQHQFVSLSSLLSGPNTSEQNRNFLLSVDQWLQERHALPFLDPALYFLGGEGEEGCTGGVVRAVIENPVFLCPSPPPEDKLVISLNNPTFSANSHSTIDLHATQA